MQTLPLRSEFVVAIISSLANIEIVMQEWIGTARKLEPKGRLLFA